MIVRELLTFLAVHAPIRHTRGIEGGRLRCLTGYGLPEPPGLTLKKTFVRTRDGVKRLAFGAAQLACLPLTARTVRRLSGGIDNVPSTKPR
ncbi:hypothetical protein [Streptomyces sp. NPDC002221]|uniref:hypothetical protein n=1 Tax=Streptomyces sp. NPDC002221 TaxID=3364639 RepID=UPI00369614B3